MFHAFYWLQKVKKITKHFCVCNFNHWKRFSNLWFVILWFLLVFISQFITKYRSQNLLNTNSFVEKKLKRFFCKTNKLGTKKNLLKMLWNFVRFPKNILLTCFKISSIFTFDIFPFSRVYFPRLWKSVDKFLQIISNESIVYYYPKIKMHKLSISSFYRKLY